MSQASNPPVGAPTRDLKTIQAAGKLVAKEAGGELVRDFFAANKNAIAAVVPKHITPEWMTGVALRALRTNPKLLDADIASLFAATITCAQLGLEPNGPQRHIWLIPFWNSKREKTEVQTIIGYPGLIELALRPGKIRTIYAIAVYSKDTFEIEYGLDTKLKHVPFLQGDRGEIIGAYAVAKYGDGGDAFEYMTLSQIERIRDNAKGYKDALAYAKKNGRKANSPWMENFEEMARKTVVRRLCKWLPMSVELAKAVAADEMGERGRVANFADVIDGIAYSKPEEEPEPDEEAPEAAPVEPVQSAPVLPLRGGRHDPHAAQRASAVVRVAQEKRDEYLAVLGSPVTPYAVQETIGPDGEEYVFADKAGNVYVGWDRDEVVKVAKAQGGA